MTNPRLCCALLTLLCSLTIVQAQMPPATQCTFLEETAEGEVDIRAEMLLGQNDGPQTSILVAFCYLDEANYLYVHIAPGDMTLGKVREGRASVLGRSLDWPVPAEGEHSLAIKVRDVGVRVLLDGRTCLSARDGFRPGGGVGYVAHGAELTDPGLQPIGEMVFHDGFERLPDDPDPWETLAGVWSVSLPEARNQKAEATRSANPFSYAVTQGPALTVAGAQFWDGYSWRAAARPDSAGSLGLVFYVQDAANCYLFRVSTPAEGQDRGRAELVRIVAGEETVLAVGECLLSPGTWADLEVRAHEGRIACFVDGEEVIACSDDTFGEGRAGLYMAGCEKALFDDAVLSPYREYLETFDAQGEPPMGGIAGSWQAEGDRLVATPVGGQALAVAGGDEWRNYEVAVDVVADGVAAVGLICGRRADGTRLLFRWKVDTGVDQGAVQELWDCRPRGRTLLAQRPATLQAGRAYRVELLLDRGYARAAVDGETVLEAPCVGREMAGTVGLQAEGPRDARAFFDNLHVRFYEPPAEPVSITEQFAKEDTMANWARPLSSWQSVGDDWYTYKLPVWGDFRVRLTVPKLGSGAAPWGVELKAAASVEALAQTASAVTLRAEPGRGDLQCTSTGDPVSLTSAAEAPVLELERRGGCVIVGLDGTPVAGGRISPAPEASVVALRLPGNSYPLATATLTSPNIIDEAFSGAPTDWAPGAGKWHMSDRWHCSPQWSWLCGRDAETPLLWYKRPFHGDMVFEFWGAMMMDLTQAPHYSHPSDLNAVICGDRESLCSGYALIFAGDNNTIGKILRRGEAVAISNDFRWDNPVGANSKFHNMWFHSRTEHIGGHLSYTVDGRAPLQYEDPEPLPGGYVGIWSHQSNGIVIARVRIAFRE